MLHHPKGMAPGNQVLLLLLLAGCCFCCCLGAGLASGQSEHPLNAKSTPFMGTTITRTRLAKQTLSGFRRPFSRRPTQTPALQKTSTTTSEAPGSSSVTSSVDKIVCQMEALQNQATELERTIFLVPILIMYWFRSYRPNQSPSQSEVASFLAHLDERRVNLDDRRAIFRLFETTKACFGEDTDEEAFYDEPKYTRISHDAYQSAHEFLSTLTPILGCPSNSTSLATPS